MPGPVEGSEEVSAGGVGSALGTASGVGDGVASGVGEVGS